MQQVTLKLTGCPHGQIMSSVRWLKGHGFCDDDWEHAHPQHSGNSGIMRNMQVGTVAFALTNQNMAQTPGR